MNMNLEWFNTIEEDVSYRQWLESTLFPDFFEESVFEQSRTLYRVDLVESLLQHAIYRGVPTARFQKADLNIAVRDSSEHTFGHHQTKWFHVNVHDNLARVVERFGRYNYDWPLVPIYIMLEYHQAMEGGTTYAGLASANREWVLLFTDQTCITVHGPKPFVDAVYSTLAIDEEA